MKRNLSFIILIVSILLSSAFSAGAVQEFSSEGLSFSVPDFLYNDSFWAEQQSYTYAFCDSDDKIEFNVNIFENEGYTYSGMDEEILASYASDFEDSIVSEGYIVESVSVESYVLSNGIEGVHIDILLKNGERNQLYWFTTEDMCYQLDFYFEDDECISYVTEIMNSVVIVPSEVYSGNITPSVNGEEETIIDDYSYTDNSYYDDVNDVEENTYYSEYSNETVNIDGDSAKIDNKSFLFVIVCLGCAVITGVIMFFKKKRAEKNNVNPFNAGGVQPGYFNNQNNVYGAQYTPVNSDNRQMPVQNNYQTGNGYIENTGYAPDYDYSNKLDITFNGTDDFSKTEYRRATANMERKFSDYEEE